MQTSNEEFRFEREEESPESKRSHLPDPPKQNPAEIAIIRNLSIIADINKRKRVLQDQINENPLFIDGILAWEIQIEILQMKEDRLLRRNKSLWKSIGTDTIPAAPIVSLPSKEKKITTYPNGMALPKQLLYSLELKETERNLDVVHRGKDFLLICMEHLETGKAKTKLQQELDEVVRLETSLMAKAKDLRLSIEAEKHPLLNNTDMKKKTKKEKELGKIRDLRRNPDRNGKPRTFLDIATSDKDYPNLTPKDYARMQKAQYEDEMRAWDEVKKDMEEHPEWFGYGKRRSEPETDMGNFEERSANARKDLDEIRELRNKSEDNSRDDIDVTGSQ